MDFKDAYLKILTKIYLNVICIHIVDFCRPSYIWYHPTHMHARTHAHTHTHTNIYLVIENVIASSYDLNVLEATADLELI